METKAPSASQPRVTRLGRTAWLVLLAGVATVAIMTGIAYNAERLGARIHPAFITPALQFAVGIGGIYLLWAVTLAVRAMLKAERAVGPMLLLNVASILFSVAGTWLFWSPSEKTNSGVELLPALLPFAAFAFVTGTWLIWPMIRWIERRRKRKNLPQWNRRERWRTAFRIGAIYAVLLGIVALPMPLFYLGAAWPGHGLRGSIVKRMPNFIRDATESVAWYIWSIGYTGADNAHTFMLREGRVSIERLEKRIFEKEYCIQAKNGFDRYPQQAADFAERVLFDPAVLKKADAVSWTRGTGSLSTSSALFNRIGFSGTCAQRLRVLKGFSEEDAAWRKYSFFYGLQAAKPDIDLIPELEAYAKTAFEHREYAVLPVIEWLPYDQALKKIHEILYGDDVALRKLMLEAPFRNDNLCIATAIDALDHPDAAVRRWILISRHACHYRKQTLFSKHAIVKKLVVFLSSNDIIEKRAAAECFDSLFIGTQTGRQLPGNIERPWASTNPNARPKDVLDDGGIPLPETPEEAKAFETIRAQMEKWLQSHDASLQPVPPKHP